MSSDNLREGRERHSLVGWAGVTTGDEGLMRGCVLIEEQGGEVGAADAL